MLRDDGQVRCVACMMCPTVCPAHCITIVPEEAPDGTHREAPQDLRDRRAPLRGVRPVRRGLPVRRHPHGHPRARQADLPPRRRHPRQGGAAVARRPSVAVQGGVGAFWREKVAGDAADAARGDVVARRPARAAGRRAASSRERVRDTSAGARARQRRANRALTDRGRVAMLDRTFCAVRYGERFFSLQERTRGPPLTDGCARPRVGKPDAVNLWLPPYESRGREFSSNGRGGRFDLFSAARQ